MPPLPQIIPSSPRKTLGITPGGPQGSPPQTPSFHDLKPPFSKLGRELESRIRKAVHTFSLWPQDAKLAVGLSGGKDSMTLLVLLKALSGHGFPPLDLYAIQVRGEFTCGAGVNQGMLEHFCQQLDVPLIVTEQHTRLEDLECYSCSRVRRALLFEAAKRHGIHTLAFGHHRDDLIETLLMNLFQKGEAAAFSPKVWMEKQEMRIIRPLVYIDEEMIIGFAKQKGFYRVSCRCPKAGTTKRRDAKELLRQIEVYFPHAKQQAFRALEAIQAFPETPP